VRIGRSVAGGRERNVVGSVKVTPNPQSRPAGQPWQLRIAVLGPMTVSLGGVPVTIASRKARALLGYLALREGTAVSRGLLPGLLWGERAENQARGSLRQTLSGLRAVLGPAGDALVATRETLAWTAGAAWIDAREAEAGANSGDPDALIAAAERLRGELFVGLAVAVPGFENWLAAERERFRRLACDVHSRLMQAAEQAGRPEETVAHGLRLLALDPLQETVHRTLMRLFAAQGRHDAALSQYERCRRELSQQLGVSPEPETEELARRIRTERRAAPSVRQPPPVRGHAPEPSGPPSIAVLPFTNLSGDPEQLYFSDGITEDIITELSRYHSLRVMARNSCFQFPAMWTWRTCGTRSACVTWSRVASARAAAGFA
jgi:DNA-binding SARP family transcriptional activator